MACLPGRPAQGLGGGGGRPAATVNETHGVIDIDSAKGSLCGRPKLSGPTTIRFDAMAVAAGGPNDKVSDLNAFWMAHEKDGTSPLAHRSGKFEDYDTLAMYYVGIGGNRNTTTRLRRYVGQVGAPPPPPARPQRRPRHAAPQHLDQHHPDRRWPAHHRAARRADALHA
jgi:hypothetical protein